MKLFCSLIVLLCFLAISACGGGSSFTSGPCPPGTETDPSTFQCVPFGTPPPSPSPTPFIPDVVISLTLTPVVDPTYGPVFGFQYSTLIGNNSEVVKLSANTKIEFFNPDASGSHTVAYLGSATASTTPWPGTCASVAACASTTASSPGTAIDTTGFTTGTIMAGKVSGVYRVPGPGFWMFGCHYHYDDSTSMRTVIISM